MDEITADRCRPADHQAGSTEYIYHEHIVSVLPQPVVALAANDLCILMHQLRR